MKRHRLILVLALLFTSVASLRADYKVVVHGSNPLESISRDKLSDIFLKKVTRWDNGRTITPVDQSEKNQVRDVFCKVALKKESAWIDGYWQKMIFSGRATPPTRLNSDSEVLDFIHGNPDAIGYVSDAASIGAGLKTISVKE